MSLEGTTIANYHVHSKLWSSGAGIVYKARDTKLNRLVALKFLPPEMNSDPAAVERFILDADAATVLDHPNIANVYEVAETEEGQLVVVTEYYDGEPLASKLVRRPGGKDPTSEAWGLHGVPRMEARPVASTATGSQDSGAIDTPTEVLSVHPVTKVRLHRSAGDGDEGEPALVDATNHLVGSAKEVEELPDNPALPENEYLDILRQIGEALAAAHSEGIFHGGIKPSDIMITKTGRVVILDFGLAALKEALGLPGSRLKSETVDYLAPEQVRGGRSDHQTDLWSTGAILYEMVSGRRPFPGESNEDILEKILNNDPEDIQSDDLRPMLQKALVKDKLHRYGAAGDLLADLAAILEPPREEPEATVEQKSPTPLSNLPGNRLYWIIGAIVLVVLAVVILAF